MNYSVGTTPGTTTLCLNCWAPNPRPIAGCESAYERAHPRVTPHTPIKQVDVTSFNPYATVEDLKGTTSDVFRLGAWLLGGLVVGGGLFLTYGKLKRKF